MAASTDRLVNAKLNLNHPRAPLRTVRPMDRQYLSGKDDVGRVGELMQNIKSGLRLPDRRNRALAIRQETNEHRRDSRGNTHPEKSSQNPAHLILRPLLVFRQEKGGREE